MINPVMKVWAGYSLSEADAVKAVSKSNVPILLIRGSNDDFADASMVEKLDKAITSVHKVVTISGGDHDDNRFVDKDKYYTEAIGFADQYLK
jgi:fermentation-respiration switch protein FrsA (DUF1100 family)